MWQLFLSKITQKSRRQKKTKEAEKAFELIVKAALKESKNAY